MTGTTLQFASDAIRKIREAVSSEALDAQLVVVRQNVPEDLKNDPNNAFDFYELALSSATLQLAFERSYRIIYGSQLSLLLKMNTPAGIDKQAVSAASAEVTAQHPQLYPSLMAMDAWVGFLVASKYAVESPAGRYEITPMGRGFLRYILDSKIPAEKPY